MTAEYLRTLPTANRMPYIGFMDSDSVVAALGALAQDTRLATMNLLVRSEPDGLPAGEIARLLGVPKNTMSSHLNVLSQGGVVTSERRSRTIIYRLNRDALQEVTSYLQGLQESATH